MGREPRIEFKGAIYHVIQRGNNKEFIFKGDMDKEYLIEHIKDVKPDMGFKIYAYVLMNNHYHLIMQTMDKPLHKIMHQINNKYSKYFNYMFNRTGHVFENRYKAILVQDERYLLTLIRYIHQNPVRAKICPGAGDYMWSSDIFYRWNKSGFVDIDPVLDSLSKNRRDAVQKYKSFVEEEEKEDYDKVKSVGEEAYQILCSSRKKQEERKRLDEILIDTGVSEDDYKLIKQGSRKRHLTRYKLAYIMEALRFKYTMSEIGQNIGMCYSAVLDMLNRHQ